MVLKNFLRYLPWMIVTSLAATWRSIIRRTEDGVRSGHRPVWAAVHNPQSVIWSNRLTTATGSSLDVESHVMILDWRMTMKSSRSESRQRGLRFPRYTIGNFPSRPNLPNVTRLMPTYAAAWAMVNSRPGALVRSSGTSWGSERRYFARASARTFSCSGVPSRFIGLECVVCGLSLVPPPDRVS